VEHAVLILWSKSRQLQCIQSAHCVRIVRYCRVLPLRWYLVWSR